MQWLKENYDKVALGSFGAAVAGIYTTGKAPGEDLVPDAVMAEWNYQSWWDRVKADDFPDFMHFPLQLMLSRGLVPWVVRHVVQTYATSARSSLTASGVFRSQPWLDELLEDIPTVLCQEVNIQVPPSLAKHLFMFFDVDGDGYITREEFVAKWNILSSGDRFSIITAIFRILDRDGNDFVDVSELEFIVSVLLQSIGAVLPVVVNDIKDVTLDLCLQKMYDELDYPVGSDIDVSDWNHFMERVSQDLPVESSSFLADVLITDQKTRTEAFRHAGTQSGPKHTFRVTAKQWSTAMRRLVNFDVCTERLMAAILPLDHEHGTDLDVVLQELKAHASEKLADKDFNIYNSVFEFLDPHHRGYVEEEEFHLFMDLVAQYQSGYEVTNISLHESGRSELMQRKHVGRAPAFRLLRLLTNHHKRVSYKVLHRLLESVFTFLSSYVNQVIEVLTSQEAIDEHWKRYITIWVKSNNDRNTALTLEQFDALLGAPLVGYLQSATAAFAAEE